MAVVWWKVPRRRLCICFCQSERDTFQNPLFQPHLSFMQKKGAVDGTKENQQGVFRIPPCTPTTATL